MTRCPACHYLAYEPGICPHCTNSTRTALRQLPTLHDALRDVLTPSRQAGQLVSGTRTPPAPLRVDALDLADTIERVVASWADAVQDRWRALIPAGPPRPIGPWSLPWTHTPRQARDTRRRQVADRCALLARHLSVLLAPPGGPDAAAELTGLRDDARRLLGLAPLRHHLPAPCPSCDRRALVRDDGSEQVECRMCRRVWPEVEYRRLVVVLAGELRREGRAG